MRPTPPTYQPQQDPHSERFISALISNDVSTLRGIPKTELHTHGNLAFHAYEITAALGVDIPSPPAKFESFPDFMRYIKKYLHPLTDTQKELEYILFHSVEMAVEDGVKFLEMSIDCKFVDVWPKRDDFLAFVQNLVHYFQADIDFLPELGLNRGDDFKDLEKWAIPSIESGLFRSIDLYGNELIGNNKDFAKLYKYAKSQGLKLKAHAGEYGDAKHMREIIDCLELDGVQHGIAAANDDKLIQLLIDRNIPLHICPSSNVALCRVDKMENHPIQKLYRSGVSVTINSDDIAVFDQTVSQEYANLFEANVLTAEELDDIRVKALERLKKEKHY